LIEVEIDEEIGRREIARDVKGPRPFEKNAWMAAI
jgi:hypothetical protein